MKKLLLLSLLLATTSSFAQGTILLDNQRGRDVVDNHLVLLNDRTTTIRFDSEGDVRSVSTRIYGGTFTCSRAKNLLKAVVPEIIDEMGFTKQECQLQKIETEGSLPNVQPTSQLFPYMSLRSYAGECHARSVITCSTN